MSRRLPPNATLAKWAITLAPAAARVAQALYETGRFRQLAIMHARTLRDGSFGDVFVAGERVWAVWSGDEPVASYPEVDADDLAAAAARARPDRRRAPDELPTVRVRRRIADASLPRPALPERLRRGAQGGDAPVDGDVVHDRADG